MHRDVVTLLGRLGLKERERRIYLACLKHKDGLFVFEIARETKLVRSTIDLTVRRMVQSGFLNKIKTGRRLRFFAQAPEAILFRQKQLADDWEQVVPLLSRPEDARKEAEIYYFEGIQGLRQVLNDVLLSIRFAEGEKKDILAFTSGVDFVRLFPDHKQAFIKKRIKNGSWYKAIATQNSMAVPEWQSDKKSLREIRYVTHSNFHFQMEIHIYADHVMLYSLAQPVGGVMIHNERIANSMRSLFHLVWKALPAGESL